jgi:hypothetical protein
MDDARQFGRDEDALVDRYDNAIEAPPGVGGDERRMHVRAYNYWVSLLGGRAFPSIEDLDPAGIDDFGPHSVLLDFTNGADNPVIAWLGRAIREECNLPEQVASLDEVPGGSLLSRLTDHYLQIIANRAPIGFEAEFVNERGNNTAYRGILMPFSSDDDTIDFIYGVINWKELADTSVVEAIVDDVDRLLQAAPVRHDTPAPVWADGPSGDLPPAAAAPAPPPEERDDEEIEFLGDGTESLGDWLAAARATAQEAVRADARSRQFLYRALSLAYDFALVAEKRPEDYAELLDDNGIVAQARAPMTPIVKLVFGIGYDKTRLAEYAIALAHGRRIGIGPGEFQKLLESHAGGLKGLVCAERAERRPAPRLVADRAEVAREKARAMTPRAIVEAPGAEEFVVLVARRVDDGHVAVLGSLESDPALVQKALRQLTE